MIDFDTPLYVEVEGVTLAVYKEGPDHRTAAKPAVFFLHGFPEIAYSWRNQLEALAKAGYPVFAYDQRGYGKSSKPKGKEHYAMAHLVRDVTGLLDHFGIEKAVFVGHDWGALLLWSLPYYCPERVLGCAGLNVALMRPYPIDPITLFRKKLGDDMYIVRFQKAGAEALLEHDVEATCRFFMRKPKLGHRKKTPQEVSGGHLDLLALLKAGESAWGGEVLLPDDELQRYIDAFSAGGFSGPLNWYRNMSENWQDQQQFLVGGALPEMEKPCLMITADLDRACPPDLADGMEDLCTQLTRVDLKDCGHWSQQEKPVDVNTALIEWLAVHF